MFLFKQKRILLLIFLQIALISIILIINSLLNDSEYTFDTVNVRFVNGVHERRYLKDNARINEKLIVRNVGNFTKSFALLRLHDGYTNHEKICFREGTKNDTKDIKGDFNPICSCKPEWHGKDCGQPEVLWRAFMTNARQHFNLSAPRKIPHNVFYIIEMNGFTLETLEIQILELVHVVDLFVLCDIENRSDGTDHATTAVTEKKDLKIRHHLNNTGFFKQYQDNIIVVVDKTCVPSTVYKLLKTSVQLTDMHPDDVLIFSRANEILSHKAINFFKWYDNWPQPVHFRLKYNVYGFFWQHPQNTVVGSVASTIGTLEDTYASDPLMILNNVKQGLTVGDLNHFGGWYCEYCAQPIDIVHQIQWEAKMTGKNQQIFLSHKGAVTAEHVQNWIVNGIYVDGKQNLIMLRKYQEKYFCPEYVSQQSWRFDNLIINIFAKWEEDYED